MTQIVTLLHGDCAKRLSQKPEGSIHAIVCDPPYFLAFMSKAWDRAEAENQREAHRVWLRQAIFTLVPGGTIKAFSGTRTMHHLAAAMADVGFQDIRLEAWSYGSGFPKSLSVSKAIDRMKNLKRESKQIPFSGNALMRHGGDNTRPWMEAALEKGFHELPGDKPACAESELWSSWGTALKPAWEPILIGTKPL
jgi:DNA modification methylase